MRVSVEEMVFQKSYQVGQAQATTEAVPESRRAPRRYQRSSSLIWGWWHYSMQALTPCVANGRSSIVAGFHPTGEGRLGLASVDDIDLGRYSSTNVAERQLHSREWLRRTMRPI